MRLGVVFADKGLKNKATQAFITARRVAEQSEAFLLSDDTEVSDSFLSELASSLVKAMQFSEALNAFNLREGLDEFLYTLANWSSSFEKFETSFSVKVLSGAEKSEQSHYENLTTLENSIRQSNTSRLRRDAHPGSGLVLGNATSLGRDNRW